MKRHSQTLIPTLLVVGAFTSLTALAQSGPIANWKELNPNVAVPTNSGMDTDSPTIGDGTANNADDAWVAGRFGTVGSPTSVTLAVGETLTVSGTMVLTGGEGVASQFRFGVFDDGGQFALDGTTWSGGWLYVPTDKLYQARTNGAFISIASNAAALGTTQTNTGTWSADSETAYDWSISVTRDSETTVDLSASVTGGDSPVSYTATVDDVTTAVFTYTAVGMLFGGNMNLDQAVLSGVAYSVTVPGTADPAITSFTVAGSSATVVMKGNPGTDYYCAGSPDLTDWTTEVVPTDTSGSPFQTDGSGDLTFTVDLTGLGTSHFFRVQDTDPSP